MSYSETPSAGHEAPVPSVLASLLYRLRAAALPPKPFPWIESEKAFIARYQEEGMLAYSIALLIGGIALFGFFIAHAIEGAQFGSNGWLPQSTRLVLSLSLLTLAYLLLTRKSWFFSNFNRTGLVGPVVAIVGVALLPFTMHESAANPGFPFARFFLSLATTIWICFAFSRINRIIIITTSAIASVALTGFAIHHTFPGSFFSSMHLAVAIWAGWALSVLIERRERQTFMSQERMTIESQAMADNIERTDLINEMQSEALQTIAHDIRQPLLSLGLYADIISSKHHEINNAGEFAGKIRACLQASENSIAIVEGVLHSAGEASLFNLKKITLTRPLTILEVVFIPILTTSNIQLKLPSPSDQQIGIWTNEHALNEIISNLISNANKHAWVGISKPTKRIDITLHRVDDRFVELIVSDNGRGIDPNDVHRIFEKGFRANNESSYIVGNGFGLAIVRGLVSRLKDHAISVQANPEGGAAFHLRIPLTNPQPLDD